MARSLAAKTVSGVTWSGVGAVSERAIALVATLVLARLLSPSAYGLLAMATVLTSFFATIRDLGTYAAIVRRHQLSDALLSTVFWVNLFGGAIGTASVAALAPLVAWFYRERRITSVLAALSFCLFLNSLSLVHRALMSREMSFRKLAEIQIASSLIAATAGIFLAIRDAGVWSLVAMYLIDTFVDSLLLWIACPWRPHFHWSSAELDTIRSFSLSVTGSNIVEYFSRNADNVLIGRYLGVVPLGYYAFAYNLMMYPIQNISWVAGKVLLPAFSRLDEDNASFRDAFLRVCAAIGTLTLPISLGMLLTADILVTSLLGPKWLAAVPLVVILAPVSLIQSLSSATGIIYLAKGRSDLQFRWSLLKDVLVVASFVAGLRWGIIGVSVAYAVVIALLTYPDFAIPFRLIHLQPRELAATLWPSFKAALWMCAAVLLVRAALGRFEVGPGPALVVAVCTGALVYGGLLLWRRPPVVRDLARILNLYQS